MADLEARVIAVEEGIPPTQSAASSGPDDLAPQPAPHQVEPEPITHCSAAEPTKPEPEPWAEEAWDDPGWSWEAENADESHPPGMSGGGQRAHR